MRSDEITFAGVLLLTLVAVVTAGSLAPPHGPVAPTMKTLAEVEPRLPLSQLSAAADSASQFRISRPGSHDLTGNITGVLGETCIHVASSGVTLDLNGSTLGGDHRIAHRDPGHLHQRRGPQRNHRIRLERGAHPGRFKDLRTGQTPAGHRTTAMKEPRPETPEQDSPAPLGCFSTPR